MASRQHGSSSNVAGECRRNPVQGSRRSEFEQALWIVDQDPAPEGFLRRPFPQQIPQLDRADFFGEGKMRIDRKSTRLNSSHSQISYAVFCLKKKKECKERCCVTNDV